MKFTPIFGECERLALNPSSPCCGLYCLVSMASDKPSSPSPYIFPFQNLFPCTADVGSALFFERVVREWRIGREWPRQHTEHVIMMEMKILTFDKHVVVKRRGNSQPVNPTPGAIATSKTRERVPLG